jgi:hypothetical protein
VQNKSQRMEGVFVLDEQQDDANPSPQPHSTPGSCTPRAEHGPEAAEARVGLQNGVPTPPALAHQQAGSGAFDNVDGSQQEANSSTAASSSSGGGEGPSPQGTLPHEPNEDIAMERRVVPLLEYSEDICSICLDEYAAEDPGAPTVCG